MDTFRSLFLVQNGDVLNGLSRGIGGAQRSPNKVVCVTKWLANIELAKPPRPSIILETESVSVLCSFLTAREEKQGGGTVSEREILEATFAEAKPKRKEPKQISFRVSESEFVKLKRSAETLQMSVPAFVKSKAQGG